MKDVSYRGYAICYRRDSVGYMIMKDDEYDWMQRPPFGTINEAKAYIDGLMMGGYLASNEAANAISKLEQKHLKGMHGTDCSDSVCRPIW